MVVKNEAHFKCTSFFLCFLNNKWLQDHFNLCHHHRQSLSSFFEIWLVLL